MENYFAEIFEHVGHERLSQLILTVTDPNTLKQSKFTNHEINTMKISASEKIHRPTLLKKHIALHFLEKNFLLNTYCFIQIWQLKIQIC